MANTEIISGVDTFVLYGAESTLGTKASTIQSHFGLIQNINPSLNRDAKEHYGFAGADNGGNAPVKITSGVATPGLSVEFKPLNDWSWMAYVLGPSATGDGTAGTPYVYTHTSNPSTITVTHNLNHVTTDRNEILLGCRFASTTIRAAVGEVVNVTADIAPMDFDKSSSIETNQNLPSGEVYNFSGAVLELPDSSAISHIIDSIEITISRNVMRKPGLGSYAYQNSRYQQTTYRINFTVNSLDETFIEDALGSSSGIDAMVRNATLTVSFTAATNQIVEFKFTGVHFPEWNETATLNEFVEEGMTGWAEGLTVEETTAA